jgi:serine/threonine-protein kinase
MSTGSRDLPAGTVLGGRYVVGEKLGRGAFSSVYRGLDRILQTQCALKILHRWATAEPALVERFKREVVLSRRVRHEGCCRVYDFVELEGYAVLTMELVEGWTFEALLDRVGVMPLPAALGLAFQAAAVVAGLHRGGVVHRDLKATNLMVQRDGSVKVLDLGLAWSSQLSTLTRIGTLLGTPTHVAPERILGAEPTVRSDVYSLGVLSYHLLTGRLPFQGHDIGQLLALQVQGEPVRPRKLRPELGRKLEGLLLQCLRKDPALRPADAAELAQEWAYRLGAPPSVEPIRSMLEQMAAVENSASLHQDVETSLRKPRRRIGAAQRRTRWAVALFLVSLAFAAAAAVFLILQTLNR